jgi:hypothetical protein
MIKVFILYMVFAIMSIVVKLRPCRRIQRTAYAR